MRVSVTVCFDSHKIEYMAVPLGNILTVLQTGYCKKLPNDMFVPAQEYQMKGKATIMLYLRWVVL